MSAVPPFFLSNFNITAVWEGHGFTQNMHLDHTHYLATISFWKTTKISTSQSETQALPTKKCDYHQRPFSHSACRSLFVDVVGKKKIGCFLNACQDRTAHKFNQAKFFFGGYFWVSRSVKDTSIHYFWYTKFPLFPFFPLFPSMRTILIEERHTFCEHLSSIVLACR